MARKVALNSILIIQFYSVFLSVGYHSFELHTFDQPRHCDACHKLLHGCYFQGYFCPCKLLGWLSFSIIMCHDLACSRAGHRECLKDVDRCSAVQPQCVYLTVTMIDNDLLFSILSATYQTKEGGERRQ